jgi:hypothetical protein
LIRVGLRISVRIRQLHRSNRTPKVVRVLSVEKGNGSVCKAYIQQSKEPGAILQIEVRCNYGRLCDLVPEVLDVTIPKLPDLSLVRGSGCAVNEPETFDFIETSV